MICNHLTRQQSIALYLDVLKDNDKDNLRLLARTDLFFLIYCIFGRRDINKDWLYNRCREVEAEPNGYLDLWFREGYKSTIITYALNIQDIICSHGINPIKWDNEVTIGIFSHTRPIAKKFLEQIKRELEQNELLKSLFPDVLYQEPKRESPKWSIDTGIIVKRKSNPREATVEAWGLVDSQPIGMHYFILNYDDVVTRESVTTGEQIEKTTEAFRLSLNLGADGGVRRGIGTRYHYNDTYRVIIEQETLKPRIHPATKDGTVDSESVFLSKEKLSKKRKDFGPYVFACQMLQNPKEDSIMGFKEEWLMFYDLISVQKENKYRDWNFYLICDPANSKKKENDYTVMWIVGLASDQNYYIVDGLRDRLNLTERTKKYFAFRRKYLPLACGYEEYGMQCDREHIEYVMEIENYRFSITPLGGSIAKRTRILGDDQVQGLVPIFEQRRMYIPHFGQLMYVDYEGKLHDLSYEFVTEEYNPYPVSIHDDMLDDLARILDPALGAEFPIPQDYVINATEDREPDRVQTEWDYLS